MIHISQEQSMQTLGTILFAWALVSLVVSPVLSYTFFRRHKKP